MKLYYRCTHPENHDIQTVNINFRSNSSTNIHILQTERCINIIISSIHINTIISKFNMSLGFKLTSSKSIVMLIQKPKAYSNGQCSLYIVMGECLQSFFLEIIKIRVVSQKGLFVFKNRLQYHKKTTSGNNCGIL